MLPFERLNLTSAPTWHFCEIGWQWSPPPLPEFTLWFVQSGQGELHLNGSAFMLSDKSCFIFEPESHSTAWHDPLRPLRIFSCYFTLDNW
ncbi:MAG: AraC family transcriptional regulator, partial [Hymenobacter sp.]